MTQLAIKEQVDAIKKTTANALRSKETARKFLVDAGILKPDEIKQSKKKGK